MLGHYVGDHEPVVDLQVGEHILTLCAPEAGKIMRCREVDAVVRAGEIVMEVTGVGTATRELFIAYRRADAPGHAGRLGERLIKFFGPGQVFKDIESLGPGDDFEDVVREMLQRAFVMVVIIGPGWLNDRIQDPNDLHREEISTALQRGIRIIPVLVNGARMPRKEDLPEDIRALATKNAVEVTDTRWDYDTGQVIKEIERALAGSPRRQRFLAQVPPREPAQWGDPGWQWITDDPEPEDIEPT